jgi:hypothetical protein
MKQINEGVGVGVGTIHMEKNKEKGKRIKKEREGRRIASMIAKLIIFGTMSFEICKKVFFNMMVKLLPLLLLMTECLQLLTSFFVKASR